MFRKIDPMEIVGLWVGWNWNKQLQYPDRLDVTLTYVPFKSNWMNQQNWSKRIQIPLRKAPENSIWIFTPCKNVTLYNSHKQHHVSVKNWPPKPIFLDSGWGSLITQVFEAISDTYLYFSGQLGLVRTKSTASNSYSNASPENAENWFDIHSNRTSSSANQVRACFRKGRIISREDLHTKQ